MEIAKNSSMVGDDKLLAATGKRADEWFALLDKHAATTLTHTEIARWLAATFADLGGWWSQSITIRYEQARGMRLPGQQADGTFTAVSTKTVSGDAPALLDLAIVLLDTSVGAAPASVNREAKTPNARWKLDGKQRLVVTVTPGRDGRASVGITHSGIRDEAGVAPAKKFIAEQLQQLAIRSTHLPA